MKIVSVCRVYPTQRPGGMPHVCQDRAEALAEAGGNDVHVLTTAHADGRQTEVVNNVTVHYLGYPPGVYSAGFAEQASKLCATICPDILHFDSLDFERPWAADRPGNPKHVAVTMHGFGMGAFLTNWNMFRRSKLEYNKMTLKAVALQKEADVLRRYFDTVIGISVHEHWMLGDCYGVQAAKLKLVYNPIPRYFFPENEDDEFRGDDRHRPADDAPLVCAAISGHAERGFDFAKKVAEKLGRPLVIAKDLARTDMPAFYDKACATLLPTFYAQGFDLTVAESLVRRRPVLASRTGSYWRENIRGLVCADLDDVDAWAQAFHTLPWNLETWEYSKKFRPDAHATAWLRAILPKP